MTAPVSRLCRVAARPVIGVTLLASALALIDLGRRILATNDEARFPLLAQDMIGRGDWFFPRLNGVVYHAKPLLQAWLIALFSWPGGRVTQLTAVLPSALAGIATAVVIYALGEDMFGVDAGRFAALIAITTQGWFLHSRLPMPDMLLTLALTGSLGMFWRMTQRRPGRPWLGFYTLVAAGFWAKGAAGLIPLIAVLIHAVATRRDGRWRDLRLGRGLLVVAVLIAPWCIRELSGDTGALHTVVVDDNLGWYLPRSLTTALVYGPLRHVVGVMFPWVLLLPAVVWQSARALRGRGAEREAVSTLVLWSLVLLASVGISEQQRLRYYAPLVPPVSLLTGWWCARAAAERQTLAEVPRWIYGVAAGLLALATAATFVFRPAWARAAEVLVLGSAVEMAVMGAGLLIMVGVLTRGMHRQLTGWTFGIAWVGAAMWVGAWYHEDLSRRNMAYDYPRLHAEVARILPDTRVVATWGVNELPFSFYFDQPVASIATDADLDRVMAQNPGAGAVLTGAALAQLLDRARFQVLPLDRLNFDSIVLVTSSDVARAPAQP